MEHITFLLLAFGQGVLVTLFIRYQRELKLMTIHKTQHLKNEIEEMKKDFQNTNVRLVQIMEREFGSLIEKWWETNKELVNVTASISALNASNFKSSSKTTQSMDEAPKRRRGGVKGRKLNEAQYRAAVENLKKARVARQLPKNSQYTKEVRKKMSESAKRVHATRRKERDEKALEDIEKLRKIMLERKPKEEAPRPPPGHFLFQDAVREPAINQ